MRFAEILALVGDYREKCAAKQRNVVHTTMQHPQWTGPIGRDDIPRMFMEMEVCADCCSGFTEIAAVVEECNREGADTFDQEELVELLGKVEETARARGRWRELQ